LRQGATIEKRGAPWKKAAPVTLTFSGKTGQKKKGEEPRKKRKKKKKLKQKKTGRKEKEQVVRG